MEGIKMQVYVGIGSDPLWAMGPAFVGMQQNNQLAEAKAAKAATAQARREQDMSSSWETIPSPKAYRAMRPKVMQPRVPLEPPQFAEAPQPPNGLIAQLIRWLQN